MLGLDGPRISWFSLPNVAPLRGRLGERASVFFYQDRYDAFQHVDAARLRIHVAALATGCELTIATASGLADDLRNLGATPLLVPHGVEVERFAGDHPVPQELREAERPLVGHVGLLDDYIALEAIREVAESLDSGTVVLVGGANVDVAQLQHPRVRILGRVPYEKIPGYLSAFDVCLAPFRVNRLTIAVNPIKLREYLAAGRPVVATDLPEMRPYADVVELVADPSDFPAAVQRVLHRGDDADAVARRRARVADASWDAIADRIGALLQSLL